MPFGVAVAIAVWNLGDFDEPDLTLFGRFDWWGLLGLAAFLGALEYVLEEGARADWFDSPTIASLSLVSALGAALFFARALTAREPIVDLTAFSNRDFALGSLFSFVMGVGLYGLIYIYPVHLARIRGHDALMIGQTMFVSGAAMFVMAPVSGLLSSRMDPRAMMALGFASFGLGTCLMTRITHDWKFRELFVPQILRGVGLMLAMIPINNVALGTLPPERVKGASGLYNLTRNLGGAVGLAMIATLLTDRQALHHARLAEAVAWGRPAVEERLAEMAASLDARGVDDEAAALQSIAATVTREAAVMSFADVFVLLTALFAGLVLLAALVSKPKAGAAGGGHRGRRRRELPGLGAGGGRRADVRGHRGHLRTTAAGARQGRRSRPSSSRAVAAQRGAAAASSAARSTSRSPTWLASTSTSRALSASLSSRLRSRWAASSSS